MTADPRAPERPPWTSSAGRGGPPLPDHVVMPLLDLITQQSLDQDYQHAADVRAARAAQGHGPQRRPGTLGRGTAFAVGAFGLIIAVAAVQTWRDAPTTASDRAALVTQIGRENDAADAQQRVLRRLKEQTTGLQRGLRTLSRTTTSVESRVRRIGVRSGYAATSGPGVRFEAADGPGDDGRIRDEDLAMMVDGLWSAGARAVSINGIRLSALSPIRTSGTAIHVDFRPISPPYTVLAVGDAGSLQARFAETTHGLAWLGLVSSFGFRFSMHNEDDVRLGPAPVPALRAARQVTDDARPKGETNP